MTGSGASVSDGEQLSSGLFAKVAVPDILDLGRCAIIPGFLNAGDAGTDR